MLDIAVSQNGGSNVVFYALDPPGFGLSGPLKRVVTMEKCGAALLEIVESLKEKIGIDPSDVFINLYPLAKENWSVGMGEMQFGSLD